MDVKFLRIQDAADRKTGRTTKVCRAASYIGATVVCANKPMADYIHRAHGVPTVSAVEYLRKPGDHPNVLWDHHALLTVLSEK